MSDIEDIQKGTYRHYKGGLCEVVGIARHSETLEPLVLYRHHGTAKDYGPETMWVRPLSMFKESVEVDGETVPRFEYIQE